MLGVYNLVKLRRRDGVIVFSLGLNSLSRSIESKLFAVSYKSSLFLPSVSKFILLFKLHHA
jgi:hypothetical protein